MPTYDRSALHRGVVHIGAGNFHRAHQAVYFDDLARSGISDRWGATGVSLQSPDLKSLLSAEDGLYTVVQRGQDGQTARVVGSIGSVHYAPNDGAAVRAALTDPQTRIVSLTITGNGYFLNPVTDEFDADVGDHKLIKTRLLNGTHIALACLATLAGYQRTDEAMQDRVIFDYVETLLRDEIQPLLPAVPGMNTPEYRGSLLDRLSNPRMSDQLSRRARRGTSKIASFVMPSLHEAIARGRPHTLLMLAVAGRARYMRGHDLQGRKLRLEDSQAIPVVRLANMASDSPEPLLGHEMFAEVRTVPGFATRLGHMIADIDQQGVVPTLRTALRCDDRDDQRELVSR